MRIYYLKSKDESLRLVQNSGTNSDIRIPNPVTEKPPGCLWFAAIQEEMCCVAMCKRGSDKIKCKMNTTSAVRATRISRNHHRNLQLFLQLSKPVYNQILRPLEILEETPGLTRYENQHSMAVVIQSAVCTINYTFAYTE